MKQKDKIQIGCMCFLAFAGFVVAQWHPFLGGMLTGAGSSLAVVLWAGCSAMRKIERNYNQAMAKHYDYK